MSRTDQTAGVPSPDQRSGPALPAAPLPVWVALLLEHVASLADTAKALLMAAEIDDQGAANQVEGALMCLKQAAWLAERGARTADALQLGHSYDLGKAAELVDLALLPPSLQQAMAKATGGSL